MKKGILVVFLCTSITVGAQKSIEPEAVKTAFAKAYPAATKIKWEKEDGNYEVTFVDKGTEISAVYNVKGVLQESEQEIKANELPPAVTAYMKEHYKGMTIKGGAKIVKADGTVNYEAAIKGKDVIFDSNGKYIKEIKEEND